MIQKIILSVTLIFYTAVMWAQQTVALTGNVTDRKSNSIAKASVYILNTNYGTITNEQGRFQLNNLKPGKYLISISAIGYSTINEEIDVADKKDIAFVLTEADVHLDEVIVSAQKKEELLQKLPLSITAFSANKVKDYRLWRNKDLTAIVPNLYSANPGDDRNVTSLRGITSTSYDPAVATYVDGVNQFSLDTYIPQLFDVERIEVLRGPQGTLYGRNAMGGVINIITKKPGNETTGSVELNFGNYGQQRYNLAIRTPLIKDKLFFGASGMYNSFNGFYTNDFNNSQFDKQHSLTGNYYLKWLASQKWAVTLNVKNHVNRNNGPFALSADNIDAILANPYHVNQNATTQMVDNTLNASLSLNYTGTAFNFSSQTAWQTNQRYYKQPIDGDFSPIDGVTIINNYGKKWNNVKALTQEFRFTSPASISSPWKWTTGIYLFYQDVPNKQATHFGEDGTMVGGPGNNLSLLTTSTGKSTGAAFFGQTSYEINERVQLTGGIRYDFEHKKQAVLGESLVDGNPIPVEVTRPDTSTSGNFSAFSPKVSINYLITRRNIAYATYSRGFRAGGFTQLSTDPSQPPLYKYKPEYSNSYEIGFKNDFLDSRVRVNVALFYTVVANAQVPILVLPDGLTITKNAGTMKSKGVEAEIAVAPVKNLEINYNFGYTDAEYTSAAILKITQAGDEVNLKDKRQIYTPSSTSVLAVQYGYNIASRQNLKLVVRGEWLNLGSQYFDLANAIRQPLYSLFNARAGVVAKNFEIMVWGRNLADKKYISYAYDFGAIHLGDPRTYGITLTGKF